MNEYNTKIVAPSTCSIIGIIFIVCKIFGVINWSWWLVLLPFWGPLAAVVLILVIAIICAGIWGIVDKDD